MFLKIFFGQQNWFLLSLFVFYFFSPCILRPLSKHLFKILTNWKTPKAYGILETTVSQWKLVDDFLKISQFVWICRIPRKISIFFLELKWQLIKIKWTVCLISSSRLIIFIFVGGKSGQPHSPNLTKISNHSLDLKLSDLLPPVLAFLQLDRSENENFFNFFLWFCWLILMIFFLKN